MLYFKVLLFKVKQKAKGNNVTSADNQQERLNIGWIVGFVDGEGCFSIGFVKQPNRDSRKGYKTGYQVVHRFVVAQGLKSRSSIENIREYFGVGRLLINRRHDNHKEDLIQYIVDSRKDLLEVIIPFFESNTLLTSKLYDFRQFSKCVRMINNGDHLSIEGLIQIAQITETMNHRKSRKHMIRIPRDQTSDLIKEKDMVPSV